MFDTPALDVLRAKTASWGSFGRGLLPLSGALAGGAIGHSMSTGEEVEGVSPTRDMLLGGLSGGVAGRVAKSILTPDMPSNAGLLAAAQVEADARLQAARMQTAGAPVIAPY